MLEVRIVAPLLALVTGRGRRASGCGFVRVLLPQM